MAVRLLYLAAKFCIGTNICASSFCPSTACGNHGKAYDAPAAALHIAHADAIERARTLLKSFGIGGVGGYTDSRGNSLIREEVADFIQQRDGHRPDSEVKMVVVVELAVTSSL